MMNEVSTSRRLAAKRAAIASHRVYSRDTGTQPVLSPAALTRPLLLPAPSTTPTRGRVGVEPHGRPAAPVRIVESEVESSDPLRHIPLWMQMSALAVLITLVVAFFGGSGTHPVASSSAPPTTQKQTPATQTLSSTGAIIRPVVALHAADPRQYASSYEYNLWWGSVCSAASMSAVFNAYGRNERITDVLKVEASLRNPTEITPYDGLLHNSAIDRTAAAYGFQTQWLHETLDSIIKRANAGHPIIVNFPPSTWSGGHFLVVTGGNATNVYLADSSKLNMPAMTRKEFQKYWVGLAVLVTPRTQSVVTHIGAYSVVGGATLTTSFINQVLAAYHSPAAGKGQSLYDLGVKYSIDPAFALAFFQHESSFGKAGETNTTLSLGNLRCIPDAACVNTSGGQCQTGQSCYASFPSWEAGFEAWYKLIRDDYVSGSINRVIGRNACPCVTVSQIIPVYAPNADHNDEAAYIGSVEKALDTWHSGKIFVP